MGWVDEATRPSAATASVLPLDTRLANTIWSRTPPRPSASAADNGLTDTQRIPNTDSVASRGSTLTLADAIREGLAANPAVRAAVAEARSAGTEVDIAEWGYYPEVNLSAGPEEFPFQEWGYDASARQMLYDWGRVASQIDNATAAEREALRALAVAEEEAALDIAEVYLDILLAQRQVALISEYTSELDTLGELTQARGQDGYSDRSERGRVALDRAQSRDELATARGQLAEAERQFRILVGLPATRLETPDPAELTALLGEAQLQQWIVSAPSYQQAVASAEQAEADVKEAQASLKPQLNLEGSLERRPIGGELQDDQVIGLRLRMDTFQGLANFQRPGAARQRLEAARYRIDDQRREIRRAVATSIANAAVYRQREVALREQIDQASDVVDLYDDQFTVGLRDINDLLTIRQEAVTARRQLADIQIQQKRIQYRTASRLGLINPLVSDRFEGDLP